MIMSYHSLIWKLAVWK